MSRRVVTALVLDVVLVLLFAAIGRASHDEGNVVLGVLGTAWPFLVGTAVGWAVVTLAGRRPPLDVRSGIPVWVCAVAVGMLLRRLVGDGTALSFVIVATIVLGVFLLGWRALDTLRHSRQDRATAS
ncbi:DUF3054 domain-containing protein [Luteipulveratus flavus]|uniref:DUF3054 domain-containing protein n=1 Tax=Luteipulveratus flavus TaxID=3031728 RepID=A0ABT6CFX4_9MICO|nr:DUF3054 domain-containing protein [Luteipulveratus sp. YIM 133296]MDF8266186.1 DUF3054 domain-containing protein [Luteipulveratus sp. YIM 133296]